MDESAVFDALGTLAECSIGLVGFAGLIFAVTRGDRPYSDAESIQITNVVLNGLFGTLYAFLPMGALLSGWSGPSLWAAMSGLHAGIMSFLALPINTTMLRRLPPAERPAASLYTMYLICAASIPLQLANAIGWPWGSLAGVYFLLACGVFLSASIDFVALLRSRLLS